MQHILGDVDKLCNSHVIEFYIIILNTVLEECLIMGNAQYIKVVR